MNYVWSEAEKNFIRKNAAVMKDWELASAIFRLTGRLVNLNQLRKMRQRLGIKKAHGRGRCEVVGREDGGSMGLHIQAMDPLGLADTL